MLCLLTISNSTSEYFSFVKKNLVLSPATFLEIKRESCTMPDIIFLIIKRLNYALIKLYQIVKEHLYLKHFMMLSPPNMEFSIIHRCTVYFLQVTQYLNSLGYSSYSLGLEYCSFTQGCHEFYDFRGHNNLHCSSEPIHKTPASG